MRFCPRHSRSPASISAPVHDNTCATGLALSQPAPTKVIGELVKHVVRADGWLVASANCAGVGTLSAPLASWRELVGDVAAQLGEVRCAAPGRGPVQRW